MDTAFRRLPGTLALILTLASLWAGCTVPSPVDGTAAAQAAPPVPSPHEEDANTQALRQRAIEFGDLLQRIRTLTKEDAWYQLQFYIEPSPDLRIQVMNYYRDFSASSEKFKIVSQSVTDVTVNPGGTSASVTYEMVAQGPGGMHVPAEQVTAWNHVEGQWYRAISEPAMRLRQEQ